MKRKIKSLKGGSCLRFEPLRATSSDRHNARLFAAQYNKNIDGELLSKNRCWVDENYPDLPALERKCIDDYNAHQEPKKRKNFNPKTGEYTYVYRAEKWKKNMSAMKEGVLILKDGSPSSFDAAMKVANAIEKRYHLKVLRVYMHADEHRVDTNGNDIYNYHAHIVLLWYDWAVHKPFVYDEKEMSTMQDIAAEITGLPRGNPTGKYLKGLPNQDFKRAMAMIAATDERKKILIQEYDRNIERLRHALDEVADPHRWPEETARINNYSLHDEEIFAFTPMAQHPIAYANCVDRFEALVEKVRKGAEKIERDNELHRVIHTCELAEKIQEQKKKVDFLRKTPSPLQMIRFLQDLENQTMEDIQTILTRNGIAGQLEGFERRCSTEGKYFERLEIVKADDTRYILQVFEATGNIYRITPDGIRKQIACVPELSNYLKASISDEMRVVLEDAFPITPALKEIKIKQQQTTPQFQHKP